MALSPFLWFYADRCAAGSSRKPVGGQGGHPLHTYLLSVDCMDEPEDTLHCNRTPRPRPPQPDPAFPAFAFRTSLQGSRFHD